MGAENRSRDGGDTRIPWGEEGLRLPNLGVCGVWPVRREWEVPGIVGVVGCELSCKLWAAPSAMAPSKGPQGEYHRLRQMIVSWG